MLNNSICFHSSGLMINNIYNKTISDSDKDYVISIFGYYIIPLLSIFGSIINLGVLLSNQKNYIDSKVFRYIQIKSFNDMCICILMIGYQDAACNECAHYIDADLSLQVYRIYFFSIQTKVLFMASNICSIGIAYHRYCIVFDSQNFLSKTNFYFFYAFALLTSILLNIPDYFAYKITHNKQNLYTLERTIFGDSLIFKYFFLIRIVLHNLISCCLVSSLNILVLKAFIKFRNNLAHLRYPVIVLLNGLIWFILSRLFNSIDAVLEDFLQTVNIISNSLRTLFHICNIFSFSISPLVYFLIDKHAIESLKAIVRNSSVANNI